MIKNMDEYALMKRFHHEFLLKFYMYDFMYVNPEKMPVKDYFSATKKLSKTTMKF